MRTRKRRGGEAFSFSTQNWLDVDGSEIGFGRGGEESGTNLGRSVAVILTSIVVVVVVVVVIVVIVVVIIVAIVVFVTGSSITGVIAWLLFMGFLLCFYQLPLQ